MYSISKWLISIVAFFVFQLAVKGQLIESKNGKFGMIDTQSGDVILKAVFDTIFVLPFDKHITNSSNFISNSPLFACQRNDSIRIFNAHELEFLTGVYNEVRFTEETDDKYYPFPKQYNPNHIDCIMLRKGNLWGYISHPKTYGFHDELTKEDQFYIIEPQYRFLRFVSENVYTGHEYKRQNRIIVAQKDSLYGALAFQTGEVIVPFEFSLPIELYANAYNRRGLEFLSMEGGFIPYYIARKGYEAATHIIINAQGTNASFSIDYPYTMEIYHENNEDYLYVFSKGLANNTLNIWNYNTGEHLFSFSGEEGFQISDTKRIDELLLIRLYNRNTNTYHVVWYNFDSNQPMLFHEGKLNRMYRQPFEIVTIGGEKWVSYKRPSNLIGKLVGSGSDMVIEWTKKPFVRSQDLD
jgi:hypothetical protein